MQAIPSSIPSKVASNIKLHTPIPSFPPASSLKAVPIYTYQSKGAKRVAESAQSYFPLLG